MKNISLFLFTILLILLCVGITFAAPYYYTFEGQITSINDGAEIINEAGLTIGDDVTYVFLIDYNKPSTYTRNNGTIYTYIDNANNDYFYFDYVSGSLIEEKDGGYYNSDTDIAEYNHGRYSLTGSNHTVAYSRSQDNWARIEAFLGPMPSWSIGDTLVGAEIAYDSTGASSFFNSSLTVTNISPAPVPIPTSMLLLGSGLIGIVGIKRKYQK
jgi:hypothetical protein